MSFPGPHARLHRFIPLSFMSRLTIPSLSGFLFHPHPLGIFFSLVLMRSSVSPSPIPSSHSQEFRQLAYWALHRKHVP